jgi:choline dehydrogenase-like flavoprotein
MTYVKETRRVPVREPVDVLVAGGGMAGVAAAVAARRMGAQVLLLEKTALLGGLATNGLINWYEPLCDGRGEQLMFGLAEELLRLSIRDGGDTLPRIWHEAARPVPQDRVLPEKQHPDGGRYATFFSPTVFQLALDELMRREGIALRLDILATWPRMEGKRVTGVYCESKTGRELFPAQMVVDATGDADLFFRAGAPCVQGRNYLSFVAHRGDMGAQGGLARQRRWFARGADLQGVGHPAGYPLLNGTTNEEVTRFLLDGRKMLLDDLRERAARDGQPSCDVTALPAQAQFRTTRRIDGAATLGGADQGMRCEASVGLVSDFERVGEWYEIPWGSLYCDGYPNLLAAGRMISAVDWAWDVTRVIPVCALTGQAAGVAAALALQNGADVARVPLAALQGALQKQAVRLHRA